MKKLLLALLIVGSSSVSLLAGPVPNAGFSSPGYALVCYDQTTGHMMTTNINVYPTGCPQGYVLAYAKVG